LTWGQHQYAIHIDGMKCSVPKVVGPWKTIIATNKFVTGIHYWEAKVLTHYPSTSIISIKIGVLSALASTNIEHTDCTGWICERTLSYCGASASSYDTYKMDDVIGVLLNLEDQPPWMGYYKNGQNMHGRTTLLEDTEHKTGFYPAVALDYGGEVELCPKALALTSVPEGDISFALYNKWKEVGGKLPTTHPDSQENRRGKGLLSRLFGWAK